jgi:hypothetical protein
MMPGRGSDLLARTGTFGRAAAALTILALFFPVGGVTADWGEIEYILTEAYGARTARECREFIRSLDFPEDHLSLLRESVGRLVEAGYPEGCPREYIRMAARLAEAGIGPMDLTNKIREGIAKKVEADRLVHVLAQRADALVEGKDLVLELEKEDIRFFDRQMAYTVMADYLLRGVKGEDLALAATSGRMAKFPALRNVIH